MHKKFLSLVLAALLMIGCCGCAKEIPLSDGTEQLDRAVVNAEYCAESSGYRMAETENGYYVTFHNILYYADKSDLTAWYPVCSKPDCDHSGRCSARFADFSFFYVKNDRIYFVGDRGVGDFWVCSRASDGTDSQYEYPIDATSGNEIMSAQAFITAEYVYGSFSYLMNDGYYGKRVVRTNENGTEIIKEITVAGNLATTFVNAMFVNEMNGDYAVISELISGEDRMYRASEDGLEEIVGARTLSMQGACILGDSIYHYVPNKGFCHSDASGENTVLLMESQLPDAEGHCMTDQCYLETNMIYQQQTEEPKLLLYYGEKWHDVALPEEIRMTPEGGIVPFTISETHLFIYRQDHTNYQYNLYRIDLTDPEYSLEFCGTFYNLALMD